MSRPSYSSPIRGSLRRFPKPERPAHTHIPSEAMSKPITLQDEIAEQRREIKMKEQVYPGQLYSLTDPSKRQALRLKQEHQLACARATLARLEALLPQQTTLPL